MAAFSKNCTSASGLKFVPYLIFLGLIFLQDVHRNWTDDKDKCKMHTCEDGQESILDLRKMCKCRQVDLLIFRQYFLSYSKCMRASCEADVVTARGCVANQRSPTTFSRQLLQSLAVRLTHLIITGRTGNLRNCRDTVNPCYRSRHRHVGSVCK